MNNLRIEKKFIFGKKKEESLKKLLIINGFTQLYQPRKISSIYLDTLNFDFAKDNINGVSKRKKIRFRWYDDDLNNIFLEEKNNPVTARKTKAQAYGTSTKNDKDLINEEFFNYQSRFPVNPYTLDIVWQAFVFACNKYIEETGMPPIEYQRETLEGGSLEWTTEKNPRRGKQVSFV